MGQFPVVEPFRCLLCHQTDASTTYDSALNDFGSDYLDHARVWDATLAAVDSDGDGCTNGVELGDADGDGQSDGNVTVLQSNPGQGNDCGSSMVDVRSWGDMKALFDRN